MRSSPSSDLTLYSPAKINLFLRVLGRREDGFHEIASLFQAVKFSSSPTDQLDFSLSEFDSLTTNDPSLPTDERNLILKAIHLFRRKSNLQVSVKVHLHKRIPIGAGLGGGSSNAATTLFAMNQLTGNCFSDDELQAFSAEIGSDISFFFSTGTAYCRGRGERVKSLPPLPPFSLWLVTPPFSLSTAEVFQQKIPLNPSQVRPEQLLAEFLAGKGRMINDLEPRAFIVKPALSDLKKELLGQGFSDVSLTGSGSSLICIGNQSPQLPSGYFAAHLVTTSRKRGEWY